MSSTPEPGSTGAYRSVPAQVDLPGLEREVLSLWSERDTFARSLQQTAGGPRWTFYEGPPTANGMPGTHHVEARVFKDVFPRFKTMKGYHVPRKAGWDCHGLPVELAVEKELGFSGKGDIEAYGVAEFNARCRESVERHVDAFESMTERMGYWVDMSTAYRTMDSDYVEAVWWSLKQIFDRGLLVQDHRVAPYCPRCGTGLSDHELAQGYETVVDPSVYVRFPLTGGPLAERHPGAALLVWTTTPWTLVSNTAVAAHPQVDYVVARTADGSETLIVAEPLLEATLGAGAEVLERLTGAQLAGERYAPPFDLVDIPDAHLVVTAEYVTTEDGSGLVHIAPAFGAEDLVVGREHGLPVINPITPDGHFEEGLRLVGGMFFKKSDETLVADLESRGLLQRHQPYEHTYPHCWRCHTPLMYYAQPSWYIRTTAIKDALLRENENTRWYPATIQHGRYGDWLDNNVDWALSRDRYWGTPLPIWRCAGDDTHLTAVGSLAELGELAGQELSALDPHRPYVDDVVLPCPTCGAEARRVPQVIDCWYDSGAMPFAQWGYPHRGADEFDASYPADFICEAIDQTRGWFYTLMAIGTLVFDASSYRTVLCLGHILDEDGRKMSKHLGNVLEPIALMDQHGADAVRWFMAASGSPWQARRVGHHAIADVVRKTLLTYWNTVSFQSLYGRLAGFDPATAGAPAPADRPVLDRWALSEAHRLAAAVDAALEDFDTQRAGRLLATFIDDLSNWYVRRSRRRFWQGDPSALATLHECLRITTLLMAPFVPFTTEQVWQDLFAPADPDGPDSVHLAAWPAVDPALVRRAAGRADGPRPAARRARPRRPRRLRGEDPPAAPPRPGGGGRLGRPARRPARPGRRGAQRRRGGRPRRRRRARRPRGEGQLPRPRQAIRPAHPACGRRRGRRGSQRGGGGAGRHRNGHRRGRGRAGGAGRRRAGGHRDAPGRLVGHDRRRGDGGPRPGDHPGPPPGRPGPRGRPARPGGPQGLRLRGQRPDRGLVGGLRRDRGGAPGARGPAGRRGAGGQPGRRRAAARRSKRARNLPSG